MSRYYDDGYDQERIENEIDLRVRWACPACGYSYEAPTGCNEGLPCPHCRMPTVRGGESYDAGAVRDLRRRGVLR